MAHTQSKSDDYDFTDIVSNWKGYISSIDKTNAAENILVRGSQNVYKKLSGTVAVRQGQKRQGSANTIISPCSSEFIWNTSWGTTYTMVISNSTLYVVINKVWYALSTSLTKTRYVFDKWWDNTLKKDQLLFVNGTANIYSWSGGFGLISSTTANTIVLDRTIAVSEIPSASGTVVINGNNYAYTGSSGSTLTGVSPTPVGEVNASAVLDIVVTHANKPDSTLNADFLKIINNQAYVGSYTSRLIYISKNTDYTDYSIPSPRVVGSAELVVLDGTGKGIGVRQGNAVLGFGANGWAVVSFSDITVGTNLTNVTTVTIKPVALLQAPLAHEFIDSVGDNLIYLGQDQQVHEFGDFNNLFVSGYPSLSQDISTELSDENFTGGGLRCIGEFIYITAPNSGKTYLRQERTSINELGTIVSEKLWHSPFVWNATRIDQIDGTVVAFSNSNPQIYEVWDTEQWHDDSPSGENLPYSCVVALSYRGGKRRQGLWSFDKNFTEGYLTPGTPLNLLMNYNYQGATNSVNVVINSITQPVYLLQLALASMGDNSLGDEPLGNGGISDTANNDNSLPKFKCINSMPLINVFEWQPVFYSDSVDAQWEILATATNANIEENQQATFIINKKSLV